MKAYDLLELAGRNLREAVLRNSLTTLGISVGVASLVAMLSLGIGLQELFNKRLGRSGLFDTIVVASRQDWRTTEDRTTNRDLRSNEVPVLDDAARRKMEKMAGVTEVYPEFRVMVEMRYAKDGQPATTHFAPMTGLPMSGRKGEAFDELQGSFFTGPETHEAILLGVFARELLGLPRDDRSANEEQVTAEQAQSLIGREITLRYAVRKANSNAEDDAASAAAASSPETEAAASLMGFSVERAEKTFRIVGIIRTEPYGGLSATSRPRVFIPVRTAENMNIVLPTDLRALMRPAKGKAYASLVVKLDDPKLVGSVQPLIKEMGFTTYSIQDASKSLGRFFRFLDLFLGIFGSLALAVASLGIVNTLVMAILERRREIGIMKALGASDGDVKKLFFVEAGAMGVFGGVIGIALGWTIGKLINFGTNLYLKNLDVPAENFWAVPWWLVAAAMGFSVLVSLISGLYPASRAAKLDPVQALRHD